MFLDNEAVECSVLIKPELTAEGIVSWKAVSTKTTRYGAAQQKRIAELEKRVESFEGQPAVSRNAPDKNKSRGRKKRG